MVCTIITIGYIYIYGYMASDNMVKDEEERQPAAANTLATLAHSEQAVIARLSWALVLT